VVVTAIPILMYAALLGFVLFSLQRSYKGGAGGGPFAAMTKGTIKKFDKKSVNVRFKDVAGLPEAKVEIKEFVDFLQNPKRYHELGAKIPKGAILHGPPGTGKTLLAKAIAGESQVPFYFTSGSEFMEVWVGVGPARVRKLFQEARENAPCIVFIDEIDAIGKRRSRSSGGGSDENDNTLNQLLVEMDGFSSSQGVVVLAGTNRFDSLDKALLRPGRFDRQIAIDLPDVGARKEICDVHLKNITISADKFEQYSNRLANLTPGFSGADIANCCNEAALIAVRKQKDEVTIEDIEEAIDREAGGVEKKSKVISPAEKKKVAFHEAGHAIIGWFLEHTSPLLKVSIVPRGQGLGYAQYMHKDAYLRSQNQLNDQMVMALGGRAAEEVVFGSITTGASDDIDKVTRIARHQVSVYGFNERIGPVSFQEKANQGERPLYGTDTANMIEEEAKKLVITAHNRAKELLTEKKDLLSKLASRLLEKEVLNNDEVAEILGQRPTKSQHYALISTGVDVTPEVEAVKEHNQVVKEERVAEEVAQEKADQKLAVESNQ